MNVQSDEENSHIYCMFNEYSNIITYDVVFLCTGWDLEVAQDDILAK